MALRFDSPRCVEGSEYARGAWIVSWCFGCSGHGNLLSPLLSQVYDHEGKLSPGLLSGAHYGVPIGASAVPSTPETT